jgi:tetratricopeptide (TPR) repeat protein
MCSKGKMMKQIIYGIALIFVISSDLALADDWRVYFDAGKNEISKGNIEKAIHNYTLSLKYARLEKPPGLRTALSTNALGAISTDAGRLEEAEPFLYESRTIFENIKETDNIYFVSVLLNIGDLELRKKEGEKAEEVYKRALGILGRIDDEPPIIATRALKGYVASLCIQNKKEEALNVGKPIDAQCN